MQLLQHLQFVVRTQAAPGFINTEFGSHAGNHRRAVAGQQQGMPAAGLAGLEQRGGISAQAVIEDKPGQRPVAVAEQ
ncbi:hypothetical protein D3C86_1819140 [compost metagenome]